MACFILPRNFNPIVFRLPLACPTRNVYVKVTSTPNIAMTKLNLKLQQEGLDNILRLRKVRYWLYF